VVVMVASSIEASVPVPGELCCWIGLPLAAHPLKAAIPASNCWVPVLVRADTVVRIFSFRPTQGWNDDDYGNCRTEIGFVSGSMVTLVPASAVFSDSKPMLIIGLGFGLPIIN